VVSSFLPFVWMFAKEDEEEKKEMIRERIRYTCRFYDAMCGCRLNRGEFPDCEKCPIGRIL